MRGFSVRACTFVGLAVLLGVLALPAGAEICLTVKCEAGNQSVTQQFTVPCNDGTADWALASPLDITSGSVRLATIKDLSIQTDDEPYVNLHFAVEAAETDASFDIVSTVVSFAPMTNPQAYASAGVTLTSDGGGATITGLFDDQRCYQAKYNSSVVFADLVPSFTVSGEDTITHSDRLPSSGYQTISGTASSIQSEFNFTLSSLGQASATSRFEIVPEPASMALLGLGGLAFIRRERK